MLPVLLWLAIILLENIFGFLGQIMPLAVMRKSAPPLVCRGCQSLVSLFLARLVFGRCRVLYEVVFVVFISVRGLFVLELGVFRPRGLGWDLGYFFIVDLSTTHAMLVAHSTFETATPYTLVIVSKSFGHFFSSLNRNLPSIQFAFSKATDHEGFSFSIVNGAYPILAHNLAPL